MAKKSEQLLPKVIEATDRESAIKVLAEILDVLHLSNEYTDLLNLKDRLNIFQDEYRTIVDTYESLEVPREYEQLSEIRDDLAFLYRKIQDDLTFEINKLKIFWGEDKKTSVRGNSMLELRNREDIKIGKKDLTASAIEKLYGVTNQYQEFVNLQSISYGMFKELDQLLQAIKLLSDSIASQCQHALIILRRDVK